MACSNKPDFCAERVRSTFRSAAYTIASAGLLSIGVASLSAQDNATEPDEDYLEALRSCQSLNDDMARLECFDTAVGNIVTATEAGDVQVVDREDVRETRRSLFGFVLPDIDLFGSDEDEEDDGRFTTTIQSARYFGRGSVRFTTAEGAVWEISRVPRRMRVIREGNEVTFREASLGYFFIRVEGQTGVKGRRVQ